MTSPPLHSFLPFSFLYQYPLWVGISPLWVGIRYYTRLHLNMPIRNRKIIKRQKKGSTHDSTSTGGGTHYIYEQNNPVLGSRFRTDDDITES
jgi:hypothetical protein